MKKLLTLLAVVLALTAIAGIALAIDVPENATVAWGEVDSITTIAGHAVDTDMEHWTISGATCTQKGMILVPCKVNPDEQHIIFVPAGHLWASESTIAQWGNIIERPTCTSTGLAIDVCLRCKITREKYRTIAALPHVYDPTTKENAPYKDVKTGDLYIGEFIVTGAQTWMDKHYTLITAPTCVTRGDAWRACIHCGYTDKTYKVELPVLPHAWTDWNLVKAPTCVEEGIAIRACASCGKDQVLTKALDAKLYAKLCGKLNPNWDNTLAPIHERMKDPTKTKGCDYEDIPEEDWLTTCYTHDVVYICPYCKCDPKVTPGTKHQRVKEFDLKLISHIYSSTPEKVQKCPIDITGLWKKETDKARQDWAYDNAASIEPTCLYDGFALYKCIYDGSVAEKSWPYTHEQMAKEGKDPNRYKLVRIPAIGHNMTDWELALTFTLKGHKVYQWARYCTHCGTTESKVSFDPEGDETIETIALESVKLNKSSLTLKVGQEKTLRVKILPANAQTKVTWKSSKKSVAAVHSDGTVVAKKKGTATITVTAKTTDGLSSLSATCKVTVK